MRRKNSLFRGWSGFSLVEVTIALGIVSFALIPIVGMLPVGLQSVKNANYQSASANAIVRISAAIRHAASTNNADFSSAYGGRADAIRYVIGGASRIDGEVFQGLGLDGLPSASDGRLIAHVEISPPLAAHLPGSAEISVAWPASAVYDTAAKRWNNAQGFVTTAIQFLPKQ